MQMSDYISRQAAIDTLNVDAELLRRVLDNTDLVGAEREKFEWGLGLIESHIYDMEELPSAQPEQKWIPCSERLPDEDYWTGADVQYSADVLMTVYNAEDEETIIDYGHTVVGSWYSDTTDCFVPSEWEVTAWMPLPEPYKGGQDG